MKKEDNKFKISLNNKNISTLKEKGKENLDKGINILMEYKNFSKKERKERLNNEYSKNNKLLKQIILVLVLIILIIVIINFIKFSPILGIKLYNTSNEVKVIENIDYSNSYINEYNDEIIYINNQDIKAYNKNGTVTWEYELENNFKPDVYINNDYMIVCNKQKSNIYVFNKYNELFNKQINGEIIDIFLDEYGNFVIEHVTSNYVKKLSLYDKKGNLKEEINLKSEIIIDIKLLNKSTEIVVITANTEGITINSTIKYIDLKDKTAKLKNVSELINEVVIDCNLINNELVILTDKRLINYSVDLNKINTLVNYEDNNVKNIKINSNYFATINYNKDEYLFNTFNYNLEKISTNKIINLPKYIELSEYIMISICDTNLQIYNKWGMNLKNIDIKFIPNDIYIINDNKSIVLVYGKKLEIINL